MAKPTNTPRWADVGGAIVEPTSGKKNVGNVPGERPPAQYLNWLFNLIYQWVAWLDTITAPGSGAEALSISSAGVLAADGKHGDRTLQVHAAAGSGTAAAISESTGRVVGTGDGDWFIPLNLKVDDRIKSLVLWGDDTGSSLSIQLYRLSSAGVRTSVAGPSAAPGAWGTTGVLNAINHTILANNAYYVHIRYVGAGADIGGIGGVYDRP